MQTISLPHGSTGFALSYDPERFQVLAPADVSKTSEEQFLVASPPLPELIRSRRVLLIVSDLTRPTGSREFLPPLLRQLDGANRDNVVIGTPYGADVLPIVESRVAAQV